MQGEPAVALSLTCLATLLPFTTSLGVFVAGGIVAVLLTAIAVTRRMVAASSVGVLLVAFLLPELVGLGPKRLVFGLACAVCLAVRSRLPWLGEIAPGVVLGRGTSDRLRPPSPLPGYAPGALAHGTCSTSNAATPSSTLLAGTTRRRSRWPVP